MKKTKILFIVLCIVLILTFPSDAIAGAKGGVATCLWVVLPSIFPFMVLCKWLLNQMVISSKVYTWFCFIFGLITGYPMGAKLAIDGLNNGQVSKAQAQNILNSCTNCGIFFIVGAVGNGMLANNQLGWKLFFANMISAIAIFAFNNRKNEFESKKLLARYEAPLLSSLKAISLVCGNIVLFSAYLKIIERFVPRFVLPMIEMTSGITYCLNSPIILAFALSFGGICIASQVKSIVGGKLSVKKYLLNKLAQSMIAVLAFVII